MTAREREANEERDMGEVDRDELVTRLREHGENDKADKAERELPKKVDKDKDQGLLDKLGLDDDLLDKIPGGLGSKLKGIL
jgi:hypothetical protein